MEDPLTSLASALRRARNYARLGLVFYFLIAALFLLFAVASLRYELIAPQYGSTIPFQISTVGTLFAVFALSVGFVILSWICFNNIGKGRYLEARKSIPILGIFYYPLAILIVFLGSPVNLWVMLFTGLIAVVGQVFFLLTYPILGQLISRVAPLLQGVTITERSEPELWRLTSRLQGATLSEGLEPRRPQSTQRFCGKCGSSLHTGDRFCPNCGAAT